MIERPVDQASGRLMKPKGWLAQMTISSARRDRWIAAIEAEAQNSSAKSRSDTASMLFAIGRSKPSADAVASRSSGKLVPASAAAPSGDSLRRTRHTPKRDRPAAETSTQDKTRE